MLIQFQFNLSISICTIIKHISIRSTFGKNVYAILYTRLSPFRKYIAHTFVSVGLRASKYCRSLIIASITSIISDFTEMYRNSRNVHLDNFKPPIAFLYSHTQVYREKIETLHVWLYHNPSPPN